MNCFSSGSGSNPCYLSIFGNYKKKTYDQSNVESTNYFISHYSTIVHNPLAWKKQKTFNLFAHILLDPEQKFRIREKFRIHDTAPWSY